MPQMGCDETMRPFSQTPSGNVSFRQRLSNDAVRSGCGLSLDAGKSGIVDNRRSRI
jgi:hypothetical protein